MAAWALSVLQAAIAIMPVGGRVAGKVGIFSNLQNGRSHSGINEAIIWVSIGMGVTIAVLISMALCYIVREKCRKRREFYVSA
ncbi:uncharacterized protein LOC124596511 [Schistocerca americana]|uniref:uncharacterized protein LOC124596511 n=1 Tax=Schistocerca americana TaxID=7009 RepID=UPI001F4F83DE|nr:uncharacterized protein LOC124596511 [Schistocerca americana]XP_047109531.1 uncharacterized protein LOC124778001 isoform X2 [Schistocerca piceifrons]XP_049771786.1 uncharacterized protein LOC126149697 [Schistocerca cancellata]XP_049799012.1 uncharacterized protein LOC126234368 [Schistocerca nitens]XP_049853874.1 uncharacterized protein LOC126335046 [Schistocerca gregaria]XP_049947845.1 uncharacterized protein LOC126456134 [Schistocerca serialis cubense]